MPVITIGYAIVPASINPVANSDATPRLRRRVYAEAGDRALVVACSRGVGVFVGRNTEVPVSVGAGCGRFTKIGIPAPGVMAPFVGVVEIVCGALLILGLFAVLATVPMLIDIAVAIATTKIPMLLKQGF